jgi:uncharacterized protein
MIDKSEIRMKGMCEGGISSFHITPDCKIYPCTYAVGNPELFCGDIENGLYPLKIKELNSYNKTDISECRDCNYYSYCISTRCKLINKCITGDHYTPSPVVCAIENVKLNVCSKY